MKKTFASILLCAAFVLSGCCATGDKSESNQRKIAVQTWTINSRTLEEGMELFKKAGITAIECYPQKLSKKFPKAYFDPYMTPEQKAFAKKMFAENNIKVIGYGVAWAKNEGEIVRLCEFAKEFGIPLIATEAPKEMLPIWEKNCEKYGLKMAIHCHQKGSGNDYYNPKVVMELIKPYKNIGVCADNGAWACSGLDVVECFKTVRGKIYEVHFKDQLKFGELNNPTAIYGTGALPMDKMLAELDSQGYDGYYIIEHGDDQDKTLEVITKDKAFLQTH